MGGGGGRGRVLGVRVGFGGRVLRLGPGIEFRGSGSGFGGRGNRGVGNIFPEEDGRG